jgi:hypothetical protein
METIDNAPIEKAANIADAVYFDLIDFYDMHDECINYDENGNTINTEKGADLYYLIENAILTIIGGQNETL